MPCLHVDDFTEVALDFVNADYRHVFIETANLEGMFDAEGRPHGIVRKICPAKQVIEESSYKHGQLHGLRRVVWGEGQHYTSHWRNGLKHGLYTYHMAIGSRVFKKLFEDGKLIAHLQ